jgi:hypothetical protein
MMGRIKMYVVKMALGGLIYNTTFQDDRFIHSKSIKVYYLNNFKGCIIGVNDRIGFIKYVVDLASGRIYIPSFITMGADIQTILMSSPKLLERLQYWYYS